MARQREVPAIAGAHAIDCAVAEAFGFVGRALMVQGGQRVGEGCGGLRRKDIGCVTPEAAKQRLKQSLGRCRLNGADPANDQRGQQNVTGSTRCAAKGVKHHGLPALERQAAAPLINAAWQKRLHCRPFGTRSAPMVNESLQISRQG